jgi:hypothetical protein
LNGTQKIRKKAIGGGFDAWIVFDKRQAEYVQVKSNR